LLKHRIAPNVKANRNSTTADVGDLKISSPKLVPKNGHSPLEKLEKAIIKQQSRSKRRANAESALIRFKLEKLEKAIIKQQSRSKRRVNAESALIRFKLEKLEKQEPTKIGQYRIH
jgi:hypothetical protein